MGAVAVGIDLGTTNSCVAIYRNNHVEIIPNEEDSYVIPSWVAFTDDGILTGHEAKDQAHKYIRNTIYEVKRLIGQRFNDEKIQRYIKQLPYQVIDDGGILKIRVEHQQKITEYFPEEISSFVLQKLRDLAEKYLNAEISKVVVTVPAYFNEFQRESTKFSAVLAGFKDVHIINEPTAAALAFSYQHAKQYKRNILVYDFGGGTFDVSIVTVGRGKCEVKATKGDLHLGGVDIDLNLVNYIREDYSEQFDEDIDEDEAEIRRLKSSCEKVKKRLSSEKRTAEIELLGLSGRDYISSITREDFENLNNDIFVKTLKIVEECIGNSGLSKEDIDEVVLVGGSSRIPKVQAMLGEYFGEDKINKGINPDEAVAYGAAIHATNLVGNKCEVLDVISLSLGIAEMGYLNSVIIQCNTPIPAEVTKRYNTMHKNQERACIRVYQGEDPLVENNFELGQFRLNGLRKGAAGSVEIDVCFKIDAEGILNVTATEIGAKNKGTIEIDVKRKGLTPEQMEQKLLEMEQNRQNEANRRRFENAKYDLEWFCSMIAARSKHIKDDATRSAIENKCDEICNWLDNLTIDDMDQIENRKQELQKLHVSEPDAFL
ncbi:hypothetical protein ILUMI_12132 [Ignelater luminosus]|uniref:Heat shock protein 70 n=1 Tax=Ignelater luminosus TaxID=2038154 RepID=A0A8K0G725_IGNLU|nr:hypothetical protein ILUMI_12132 [Ignelater luminosus]